MHITEYFLLLIVLLLGLGAVVSFSMFVIKPMQTHWAVKRARKIVASGRIPDDWHFLNVYRLLATAHDDLAAKLWRQIDGMQDLRNLTDVEFRKIIGLRHRDEKY